MRREAVLGAVPPVAKLAHVERVRLLVLVLEVTLQRVIARECAMAVGTLLGFINATTGRWRHPQRLPPVDHVISTALRVDLHVVATSVAAGTQAEVVVSIGAAVGRLSGAGGLW